MTNYFQVTVAVEGKDEKTRFRRVGTLFQNKPGSKAAFTLRLDFPVGATEFAIFEPKSSSEAQG